MEETLEQLAESAEGMQGKFYGLATGFVRDVNDPLGLGRVRLELPMIDNTDLSPWARIAVPLAGLTHAHYFPPLPNDEVIVAFEHGDLNAPYVIGSLWNAAAPPPLPSPLPQIRMLKTTGTSITFADLPPTITIETALPPPAGVVTIGPTGVKLESGLSTVEIGPTGVKISAPTIELEATATLDVKAPKVKVDGTAKTDVGSSGICSIKAPMVKIN